MSSPPSDSAKPLSIGRLVEGCLGVIGRDWVTLFAIGIVFKGVTVAVQQYAPLIAPGTGVLPTLARYFLYFAPFTFGDAALTCAAVARLSGGQVSIASALRAAVRIAAAAFVIDLAESAFDLANTLLSLGPLPQTIPYFVFVMAVINNLWLAFLVPALAVEADERKSAFSSLARALRLTGGHRLRLFAFLLIVALVQMGLPMVLAIIAAVARVAVPNWVLNLALTPVEVFASVSQAVIYWELLRLREGVRGADVEQIFG